MLEKGSKQVKLNLLKMGGREMKGRIFYLVFAIATGIILAGCGGGSGDSSSSTGTISMNITDAKPVLPVSGTVDSGVDEEYTKLSVPRGSSTATEVSVFWLVPEENYFVQAFMGDANIAANLKYEKFVPTTDWAPNSKVFFLKGGTALW
jgi:hypothetical protein